MRKRVMRLGGGKGEGGPGLRNVDALELTSGPCYAYFLAMLALSSTVACSMGSTPHTLKKAVCISFPSTTPTPPHLWPL